METNNMWLTENAFVDFDNMEVIFLDGRCESFPGVNVGKLLLYLAENRTKKVFSADELIKGIWGYGSDEFGRSNTNLNAEIKKFRGLFGCSTNELLFYDRKIKMYRFIPTDKQDEPPKKVSKIVERPEEWYTSDAPENLSVEECCKYQIAKYINNYPCRYRYRNRDRVSDIYSKLGFIPNAREFILNVDSVIVYIGGSIYGVDIMAKLAKKYGMSACYYKDDYPEHNLYILGIDGWKDYKIIYGFGKSRSLLSEEEDIIKKVLEEAKEYEIRIETIALYKPKRISDDEQNLMLKMIERYLPHDRNGGWIPYYDREERKRIYPEAFEDLKKYMGDTNMK